MHRNAIPRHAFWLGLFILFSPASALAYCLVNQTAVALHGQSLDSQKFARDLPAGKQVCCDDCVNPRRGVSTLLIVTGYVPVTKSSQPGWGAECRIRVKAADRVVVTGDAARIACTVQAR